MTKITSSKAIATALLACGLSPAPAQAGKTPATASMRTRRRAPRQPPSVDLHLDCNVVATYNNFGLGSDANSTLRVAHLVVTGNGTAVVTSGGGAILSYGANDINGNTVDNFGALTPIFTH